MFFYSWVMFLLFFDKSCCANNHCFLTILRPLRYMI
jgi:hypothetical protein